MFDYEEIQAEREALEAFDEIENDTDGKIEAAIRRAVGMLNVYEKQFGQADYYGSYEENQDDEIIVTINHQGISWEVPLHNINGDCIEALAQTIIDAVI